MELVQVNSETFPVYEVLQKLVPHRLVGASKVRLGRPYDGGYVMLDDFQGIEAAYSIGINDDVSWDADIVARGIPVFQYDHTIADTPMRHPLMHWRQVGLGPAVDSASKINTLAGMLAENGHAASRDLILKCDVEGHEWRTFANTPARVIEQFRHIAMEVHAFEYLGDHQLALDLRESIDRITASHHLVHVHANNFSSWNVNTGVPLPNVMEMTFARKDLGRFEPSGEIFPTALDMPCDPSSPDYYLGPFIFKAPEDDGRFPVSPHMASARRPAGGDFIASCYELFLGRALETDEVVRDRGAWPTDAVLKSILTSEEFTGNVYRVLQAGGALPSHGFAGQPTRRLRYWAAERLSLLPHTREEIAAARTWRELLQAILSDQPFMQRMGMAPLPAPAAVA